MKDVAIFARATKQIIPAYRDSFERRATIWTFACGCVLGQRRGSFKAFESGKYDFVAASCGDETHTRTAALDDA